MQSRRFDDLARSLATGASRRLVIKGLAGAAGGGLLSGLGLDRVIGRQQVADQQCVEVGAACVRDEACCSRFCDQAIRRCACGDGQGECDGECVDVRSDPDNCGACDEACSTGQRCLAGSCCSGSGGPCDGEGGCCGDLTCCDGRCTDPNADPENCGGCEQTCPYDPYLCEAPTCESGACGRRRVPNGTACVPDDPSYACCDGGCADLYREGHCGECGRACANGETCCRGEGCYDLEADAQHCGGCFHGCNPGEACVAGICCPGPGSQCASDADCCGGDACCGGRCAAVRADPLNCGACATICPTDLACIDGACATPSAGLSVESGPGRLGPGQGTPPSGQGAPIGGGCGAGVTCGAGAGCCSGRCADFSSDPLNCSGCSRPCSPGQACSRGTCVGGIGSGPSGQLAPGCGAGPACGTGRSCCGGACVDLALDPTNCGGCGQVCRPGETCCNGGCVGFASCPPVAPLDRSSCACRCSDGRPPCGSTCCGRGERCLDRACVAEDVRPPCGEDAPCDPGYECCAGICGDPRSDRTNCGGCGTTCGDGKECCNGHCVSLLTGANCGACGIVCPPGACCRNGECLCSGGYPPCDGACRAISSDPANCGVCGNACTADEHCDQGACRPTGDPCGDEDACPDGYGCCDGVCSDLRSDPTHCGACQTTCEADPSICRVPACGDGVCGDAQAPDGSECRADDPYYRCCGGSCVNTRTDPLHCGACGYECPSGSTCCGGEGCFALQADPLRCGACDNTCPSGETCLGGTCAPIGAAGTGCDDVNGCADGLTCCDGVCRDTRVEQDHCGACDAACANLRPPCAAVRSTAGTVGLYPPSARAECVAGDQYYVCCEANCTDVLSDPANCGACGYACGAGQECALGACAGGCEDDGGCAEGQQCCEGTCRDTRSDPNHCGSCEQTCRNTPENGDELCCEGVCTAVDAQNCGFCGYVCPEATSVCEPDEAHSSGYHCCAEPGGICDPRATRACCGEGACVPAASGGYVCCVSDGGRCEPHGCAADGPCGSCCSGYCGSDGACAPDPNPCEDGQPACGEACCGDGQTCCAGFCVDTQTDPDSCGSCQTACPRPEDPFLCLRPTCDNGVCGENAPAEDGTSCVEGDETFACCGGVCTDLINSLEHCGACGVVCAAAQTCCGDGCYDVQRDPAHCGDCGRACPDGMGCDEGRCCQQQGDECGAANQLGSCCPGLSCVDGTCEPTIEGGQPCADDPDCPAEDFCCDGVCVDPFTDPAHCGACGLACPAGLACEAGLCCHAQGQGCDADNGLPCCSGGECVAGVCRPADLPCAPPGEACQIDTDCCDGGTCANGVCTVGLDPCAAITCAPGTICCDGECANLSTSLEHCGSCGSACRDGEECADGQCRSLTAETCDDDDGCPDDHGCCDGTCYDLTSSITHCGNCETACRTSEACADGECVPADQSDDPTETCEDDDDCPGDDLCCGGTCVDPQADPHHCGACYGRCPAGECEAPICEQGRCGVEAAGSGNACDAGGCVPDGTCQDGTCTGQRQADGTSCYDGNPCQLPGRCTGGRCEQEDVPNDSPCEVVNPCLLNGTCQEGYCYGAYAADGTACDGGGCAPDGGCRYGVCLSENAVPDGAPCDDGNACTENDACSDGVCRGVPIVCDLGCNTGFCRPEQGCIVAGAVPDLTTCPSDPDSFCCAGVCCAATAFYDACTVQGCCFAESASPDGQVCCDIGDPSQGRGIGEYWVGGYGCCRVHLACGDVCCPGLIENGEADTYCDQGACREANLPCDAGGGCTGDEVCIEDRCCPGWRACGSVCCAQNEHCENGACAPGYPRILRQA